MRAQTTPLTSNPPSQAAGMSMNGTTRAASVQYGWVWIMMNAKNAATTASAIAGFTSPAVIRSFGAKGIKDFADLEVASWTPKKPQSSTR